MKKTIWFDITNVPHVNFLLPIIERYKEDYHYIFSLRDFAETKGLFEKKIGVEYLEIGKHFGKNKISKAMGTIKRIFLLRKEIPNFDIKISVGGDASSIVTKMRHKISITFDDNEKSPNWRYAPFSDFAFWPNVISLDVLRNQFFKNIYQYHGYKEDVYLADYRPDKSFLSSLPFEKYVVVRPENIKASYVKGKDSIVPLLLKVLSKKNINVLYLPRYESDKQYANDYHNVYMPSEAVNGLDACYFSDAVLTGAGTMAREAACMGVPAVSFYAGADLLTVDKSLIADGKMFFSRNVEDIMNFLKNAKRQNADLDRCKAVQQEVFAQLDKILNA